MSHSVSITVLEAHSIQPCSYQVTVHFRTNFIQVDIFYKELSFETIEQKESFTVISLFSEVGGFMGLLLGASLLSLCEVIDYFAMMCMASWHKRKMRKATPGAAPAWQK